LLVFSEDKYEELREMDSKTLYPI